MRTGSCEVVCPRCAHNEGFRLLDDGTVNEFTSQPIAVLVCPVCETRMNIILLSDERVKR